MQNGRRQKQGAMFGISYYTVVFDQKLTKAKRSRIPLYVTLLYRHTTFFLETPDVLRQCCKMVNEHFCEIFWNSVVKPGRESTSKLLHKSIL